MGLKGYGVLYVLVGIEAIGRAFDGPARNALLVNLVEKDALTNALSLNGIAWRLSDVTGPIITGLVIAYASVQWCYVIDLVLGILLFGAILLIKNRDKPEVNRQVKHLRDVVAEIKDGIAFMGKAEVVRQTMIIDFWATFFSSADALLPAFAGPILMLGASGYGTLAAASGIGALTAAVIMAYHPNIRMQGAWVVGMVGVYGMCTIFLGVSTSLWMAIVALACTGAADMFSTVLRQTIRQLGTPDNMRGRMTGVSTIFQRGGPQLGDVEAGVLASLYGDRQSVIIGGTLCLFVSGWYWAKSELRRYKDGDDFA